MFKSGTKFLLLSAALLNLSACGFHSVYGSRNADGTPVAEQLAQVTIDPIPERAGQMLRNDLIDRMYGKGRPSLPTHHLIVKLKTTDEDLGTLANGTTALADIHTTATYELKDANGKTVSKGTTSSTAQYDKLTSEYATLAAHEGALERTVREVSEQLTGRISLYFAEQPTAP